MNYDYKLLTGAPTRQCLICKCKEQPRALFVDFGEIWLCDDCKPKMSEQEIKQIEEMMQDFGAIYNTVFKGGYKYSGLRDMTERLYNAGYRKQEWISIADRLPEDSMTVITFNTMGEVDADYYAAYSLGFTDKTVTHWMPLPEPPKMKGGAE